MDCRDEEEETASPSSSQNPRGKRVKKKMTLSRLLNDICASQETCIEWLKNQGFIPKILFCPTCSRKMKFEEDESALDGFVWACKECCIDPPHYSARHGSWLESKEASLADILLLSFLWSHGFSKAQMAKEANIGAEEVQQWDDMCVEICESLLKKNVSAKEGEGENSRKGSNKESTISTWRRKNKNKDLFLEFLKDADSL